MRKQSKLRYICAGLCLILSLLALSSCVTRYANEQNYSGEIDLPADGIVKAEVLDDLKKSGSVAVFCGKSGKIAYQWTVFGSDIQIAHDINLGITAKAQQGEKLSVKLDSAEDFGFCPVLSVYLNERWQSLTATVSDGAGNALSGASLTNTENTIVNFTIKQGIFAYEISGDGYSTAFNPTADETPAPSSTPTQNERDDYLSQSGTGMQTPKISDGSRTDKDKYGTDPVPDGKQEPVEPEDSVIDESIVLHCTISIECATILNNLDKLTPEKVDVLPKDGIILKATRVEFYAGESVFDVLQRVCRENKIHLEATFTPMYNSAYIEGIGNIYEMDCGELSGWCYRVNGWYPNYGCSRYAVCDGDNIEFRYTCDLGRDIGSDWSMGD